MTFTRCIVNTGRHQACPSPALGAETSGFLEKLVQANGGWIQRADGSAIGFAIAATREDQALFQVAYREAPRPPAAEDTIAICILAWSDDAIAQAQSSIARIAQTEGRPMMLTRPTAPALITLVRAAADGLPGEVLTAAEEIERGVAWTILRQEGLAT